MFCFSSFCVQPCLKLYIACVQNYAESEIISRFTFYREKIKKIGSLLALPPYLRSLSTLYWCRQHSTEIKKCRNVKQGEVSLIFAFRFSLFVFRFSFFDFRFSLFVFRFSFFVFRFSFFVFHFCHFAMSEIRYDAISNPILLITNRENMLFWHSKYYFDIRTEWKYAIWT